MISSPECQYSIIFQSKELEIGTEKRQAVLGSLYQHLKKFLKSTLLQLAFNFHLLFIYFINLFGKKKVEYIHSVLYKINGNRQNAQYGMTEWEFNV